MAGMAGKRGLGPTCFAVAVLLGCTSAVAGEPPLRHADLVEALRSLDGEDAYRAHALLVAAAPRGLAPSANPVSEIESLYAVKPEPGPGMRGHMRGPVMRSGLVESEAEFSMVFEGGEGADVTVYTDRDGVLEVMSGEDSLCRAQTQDGVAHCQWMPFLSKSHTIKLSHSGAEPLRYTLMVN